MQNIDKARRGTRVLGAGVLIGALALGLASTASADDSGATSSATTPTPTDATNAPAAPSGPVLAQSAGPSGAPYGAQFPVTLETNFARPVRALSSNAYSDFTMLNDLERLIRGTYINPTTNHYLPEATRLGNRVDMSMSRMENSQRVGRVLIAAAKKGVHVRFVHGKSQQSGASRSLQRQLNAATYHGRHTAHFYLCSKGKSLACLSSISGGIIHTKSLIINRTYTRDKTPSRGTVWYGSANIGGPSAEHTWNDGMTVYNDKKLYIQSKAMFNDLVAERNVGNNYPAYIAHHASKYGYSGAKAIGGYSSDFATSGVFYSNLSNVTIFPSPVPASPTNGRDPIMNALNRVVPDEDCRIRVLENRWKYRRLAIAQKLVELANGGCEVSAIAYQDDLKVNRIQHCQIYIRICRPILDELRTANVHIDVAWAKPHDKVILFDARMKPPTWANRTLAEAKLPDGSSWPSGGARVTMVQAGSAALTGSNLSASDEITTETTDPQVYANYLEHWRAINRSREFRPYSY